MQSKQSCCATPTHRHFADRELNVAVVEVGMGGILDATNVFDEQSLAAAVITPLGAEVRCVFLCCFCFQIARRGAHFLFYFLFTLSFFVVVLKRCADLWHWRGTVGVGRGGKLRLNGGIGQDATSIPTQSPARTLPSSLCSFIYAPLLCHAYQPDLCAITGYEQIDALGGMIEFIAGFKASIIAPIL